MALMKTASIFIQQQKTPAIKLISIFIRDLKKLLTTIFLLSIDKNVAALADYFLMISMNYRLNPVFHFCKMSVIVLLMPTFPLLKKESLMRMNKNTEISSVIVVVVTWNLI